MQFKWFSGLAVLFALSAPTSAGIVSLFIPDVTESIALSASQGGTDDSGRTTWVIGAGQSSDGLASPTVSFAPITLVAGPSDAHRVQSVLFSDPPGVTGISHPPTFLHDDCAVSGTVAVCTRALSVSGGAVSTATVVTEPASAVAVQLAEPTSGSNGSGSNGARGGRMTGRAVVVAGVAGVIGSALVNLVL